MYKIYIDLNNINTVFLGVMPPPIIHFWGKIEGGA